MRLTQYEGVLGVAASNTLGPNQQREKPVHSPDRRWSFLYRVEMHPARHHYLRHPASVDETSLDECCCSGTPDVRQAN